MKLYPKTRLGREGIKSKDFFTAKAAKIAKVEIFRLGQRAAQSETLSPFGTLATFLRKWFPLEFLGSNRFSWIGS